MPEEIVEEVTSEVTTEETSETVTEETPVRRRRKSTTPEPEVSYTVEQLAIEVAEPKVVDEPVEYMSAQTLAEMKHGADSLKKHIASSAAE